MKREQLQRVSTRLSSTSSSKEPASTAAPPSGLAEQVLHSCGHAWWPHLEPSSRQALRLVCKLSCRVIDDSVTKLSDCSETRKCLREQLPPPARWPGVTQLLLSDTDDWNRWHDRDIRLGTSTSQLPPRLDRVELTACLTDEAVAAQGLLPLASLAPTLRHLVLARNEFCFAYACDALTSVLSTLTSLEHLCMYDNSQDYGSKVAEALSPALPCLTNLKQLCIMEVDAEDSFDAIVRDIAGLTLLEHLRLDLRPSGVKGLAPALQGMTRIQSLDISTYCAFCPEIASDVAAALAAVPSLQSLRLDSVMCSPSFSLVAPSLTALHTLILVRSGCADHGRTLAEMLQALPSLTSLALRGNAFAAPDWQHLGPGFGALTGLQQLDLSSVSDGGGATAAPGAAALALALPQLKGLRVLKLGDSQDLVVKGAAHLLPAMGKLHASLEELDLATEWDGDAKANKRAAPWLAEALSGLTRLRKLHLAGFDAKDTEEAVKVLPTSLSTLALPLWHDNWNWSTEAQKAVLSATSHLLHLQHLDIAKTFVNSDQVKPLLPELRRLTVLTALLSLTVGSGWSRLYDDKNTQLRATLRRALPGVELDPLPSIAFKAGRLFPAVT